MAYLWLWFSSDFGQNWTQDPVVALASQNFIGEHVMYSFFGDPYIV